MRDLSEEEALSRLRAQDPTALHWLIWRYNRYVASIIRAVLGKTCREEDAEELTADVFYSVFRRAGSISPGKLQAYLGAAARNRAKDFLRKQKPLEADLDELTLPDEEGTAPEAELLRRERQMRVKEAIFSMEPVDREGHSIIDFSMYDARRAGFRDLVFIIKREHEALFRERIGTRMERFFHVEYVYQELTDIPAGYSVPDGRVKPWGTGQAVACCRNVLHGPFAVINSDDFYGRTAFSTIYEFLRTNDDEHCYAMVGYRVRNTVTEFGSVARGVCEVENGMLTSITERMQIYQRGDHAAYTEDGTQFVDLPGDTIVSMNLWGFTQPMVSELWSRLSTFLAQQVPQNPMKCEFYLPNAVNQQLEDGTARVRVLPCEEVWHGVTYREDLASVKEAICALKAAGVYEERLWPD